MNLQKKKYLSPECLVVKVATGWLMDLDIPVNTSKTTDVVGAKHTMMFDDEWEMDTNRKNLWSDDDDDEGVQIP